jgi:hypothetical protein
MVRQWLLPQRPSQLHRSRRQRGRHLRYSIAWPVEDTRDAWRKSAWAQLQSFRRSLASQPKPVVRADFPCVKQSGSSLRQVSQLPVWPHLQLQCRERIRPLIFLPGSGRSERPFSNRVPTAGAETIGLAAWHPPGQAALRLRCWLDGGRLTSQRAPR